MLGNFEATELRTIFTADNGSQVEVRCKKAKDDIWEFDTYIIKESKDTKISLYDRAQAISELLAKGEINTISYKDYDTTFTLSGKHTTEQVLVEMAKKM